MILNNPPTAGPAQHRRASLEEAVLAVLDEARRPMSAMEILYRVLDRDSAAAADRTAPIACYRSQVSKTGRPTKAAPRSRQSKQPAQDRHRPQRP